MTTMMIIVITWALMIWMRIFLFSFYTQPRIVSARGLSFWSHQIFKYITVDVFFKPSSANLFLPNIFAHEINLPRNFYRYCLDALPCQSLFSTRARYDIANFVLNEIYFAICILSCPLLIEEDLLFVPSSLKN